jgi:hypothetical protein
MIDRPPPPWRLLFGAAALVAALGALGWLLVRTERRMTLLEEQLARTTAPGAPRQADRTGAPPVRRWPVDQAAPAEPAREAPPSRRAQKLAELHAPAQPRMPEAKKFAEERELDELEWRTLTRLNGYWMDTLAKAAKEGEDALPDKLDYVAKQRDIKLHGVMGSDEGVASYRQFEGSLQENRVTYKAKDGTVYGAAPFE